MKWKIMAITSRNQQSVFLFALVVCLLLAFAIRTWRLGEVNLWTDELLTLEDIRYPGDFGYTFERVASKGDHVPLFHISHHLLPFAPYTNPLVLRYPVVLVSILLIAMCIRLMAMVGVQKHLIVVGVLILSFQTPMVEFSRNARMYPMLMLFFVISSYFLFRVISMGRAMKDPNLLAPSMQKQVITWGGFVLANAGLFTTHLMGMPFLGAQTLAIAYAWIILGWLSWKFVARWWLAVGVSCIPITYWGLFVMQENEAVGSWIRPISRENFLATMQYLVLGNSRARLDLTMLVALIVALCLWTLWRQRNTLIGVQVLYWGAAMAIPIVFVIGIAVFVRPMWHIRYVLPTLPAFVILITIGLNSVPRIVHSALVVILLPLMLLPVTRELRTDMFEKDFIDDAFLNLDGMVEPGDGVYIHNWGNYHLLYADELQNIEESEYLNAFDWFNRFDEDLSALDESGFERVWILVQDIDRDFTPEDHSTLELIEVNEEDVEVWLYEVPSIVTSSTSP
jgi:hypothetical protein